MTIFIRLYPFKFILVKIVFIVFFILAFGGNCFTQVIVDSLNTKQSEANNPGQKITIDPTIHSPKKAAIMSALLPGLGQVYNKKYWKVPIIYAGVAGLTYSINFNQKKYIQYREAFKTRIDGDPATVDNFGFYSDDNLNTLQKYYHRNRDLSVIGVTILYILNVIDANVDAHLFTFNVEDDLSINIRPTIINTAYLPQVTTGISLSIKF